MTAALAFAAALAACSNPDAAVARRLPDARLHTLAGTVGPSLSTCPTEKCLTIVVAPWCGICHMAAPDILRLRRFLDTTGVASRVVVGLAEIGPIREFAAEFGPDSLLDPEGAFHPRGVPLFLVSDSNGKVLRVINGFPKTASASALADALGLL
ncbi:MAG TPA: hypothetical protein DCZ01_05740 [Elusimicrobia bacterium]|nr:MAG: hypothetical protein A2X37_11285 [Elusimicrobia bacterium GWA2_66_18]HAZ08022.1 hypothetical protein [Elusimicrobiota bacterium]